MSIDSGQQNYLQIKKQMLTTMENDVHGLTGSIIIYVTHTIDISRMMDMCHIYNRHWLHITDICHIQWPCVIHIADTCRTYNRHII